MTTPNNTTGCYILDAVPPEEREYKCLDCPRKEDGEECIIVLKDRVKDSDSDLQWPPIQRQVVEECQVKCLTCKSMETLTFRNGILDPTQKWYQVGEEIRHRGVDCGIAKKIRRMI